MRPDLSIWCVRHGESSNVVTGACGALPVATLTELGRRQAAAAGDMLVAQSPTPSAVYASTARRAVQTADVITGVLGLSQPPACLDELVECGLGSREGATDGQTRAEGARVLHAWVVLGELRERVADGESGHQVVERIRKALHVISDAHPGGTVVLVGHVASLTAGLAALGGIGAESGAAPCRMPCRFWSSVTAIGGGAVDGPYRRSTRRMLARPLHQRTEPVNGHSRWMPPAYRKHRRCHQCDPRAEGSGRDRDKNRA